MKLFFYGRRLLAPAAVLLACALSTILWPLNALAKPATSSTLTLQQAAERVLATHPQFSVLAANKRSAQALAQQAALAPGYELGVEAENMAGSGDMAGIDQLALTVSLSSLYERGDKRQSRVQLADATLALADARLNADKLALLGELTQRFIAVLTLQHKHGLAQQTLDTQQQALTLVQDRVQRAASPQAELLRADVAVQQARLALGLIQAELGSARQALAVMWQGNADDITEASGELFVFAASPDFEHLYQQLLGSQLLQLQSSEQRQYEAVLAQVQSQSLADVRWQLGIVREQQSRDLGFSAAVSVPLSLKARNQPAIRSARADVDAAEAKRQLQLQALRQQLYQAWQRHRYSSMAVADMQRSIVPALQQALAQTQQAYQRGRYSYSEWLSARQALQQAELELIDAASTALSNQALIEQLCGITLQAHYPRLAVKGLSQ